MASKDHPEPSVIHVRKDRPEGGQRPSPGAQGQDLGTTSQSAPRYRLLLTIVAVADPRIRRRTTPTMYAIRRGAICVRRIHSPKLPPDRQSTITCSNVLPIMGDE